MLCGELKGADVPAPVNATTWVMWHPCRPAARLWPVICVSSLLCAKMVLWRKLCLRPVKAKPIGPGEATGKDSMVPQGGVAPAT
eukprot:9141-Karenia_brevis.AAC.1